MGKIIGLILALLLIPTCKTSAGDSSRTKFDIEVQTGQQLSSSDGRNTQNVEIPISDGLVGKGWKCALFPKKIINSEIGQGIVCVNGKTGSSVTSIVRCNMYTNNHDSSNFILDDVDANVTSTVFSLNCSTVSGQSI